MTTPLVKMYLHLTIAIISFKNSFQHNQPSDDGCLYEHNPDLSLKYFMHKRNITENIEDRKTIDAIKDWCGELCQTFNIEIQTGSNNVQFKTEENNHKLFEPPSKQVRCDDIWRNPMIESHKKLCVPHRISDPFEREFSYNYTIDLEYEYYDDSPRRKTNGDEIKVKESYHIECCFCSRFKITTI